MQILLFSDIHGQFNHLKLVGHKISQADLILLSGDITNFGRREKIKKMINWILDKNSNLFTVPGNCDTFEVEAYLSEIEISLHGEIKKFNHFNLIGMGGSLRCPGSTPIEFAEKEFESVLNQSFKSISLSVPHILMTHQPPLNSAADQVSPNIHVGSQAIRRIIDLYQPLLSVCGHIHESKGKEQIGKTWVVNPGPMRSGNYAIIEMSDQVDAVEFHHI